ncbi:MAG: hypothetical protein JWP38_1836 [Herbaspirillum sp.]|nr:hypothetical protein [Herbaspirillum sp.]
MSLLKNRSPSRAASRTALAAALLGLCCSSAMAEEAAADAPTLTGHVDLVSRYILRGITSTYGPGAPLGNSGADAPESNKPALQWGADWLSPSGIYLGYFGSMINYSYQRLGESYTDRGITDFQSNKSIENDLYGGYNGKIGDFGYIVGMTGYIYLNGKHANALETKLGVSYGDFALNAQTLLQDVVWGNKGDTYWTLNYTKPLPYSLTFTGSLGYYSYAKNGKYLGDTDTATGVACGPNQGFAVNACMDGHGPVGGAFRHLILGVTQPIFATGASWGLQGILGGKNRFGVSQKNQLVASLSYGF